MYSTVAEVEVIVIFAFISWIRFMTSRSYDLLKGDIAVKKLSTLKHSNAHSFRNK